VYLDSFVGRRREIAEVRRLLEGTRLLTLTGPGGAGKTRLAARVAAELAGSFADGVRFVELGEVREGSLVPAAVAAALGLRDLSTRGLTGLLADYLAPARLLLVLDNCEQVIDAAALLVHSLLRVAPGLKVLVTSRQPLRVEGEVTVPLPPLTVPPLGASGSAESLAQYESVNLFVERGAAVQPGFSVTSQNASAVAQLCRELEGIPLAIELAAVRLRALTVEQLVARLQDRFRLLSSGSRTAAPRQQTLEATMQWSFDLLSEPERILWRRLAVFVDGFELEAAENVCAGAGLPAVDVLDVLAGLVDRSIVLRQGQAGRPRYRMLETIRQYGRRRLVESGEEPELRKRHLDWFAALGEQAEPAWWGPDQAEWFDRLEAEHGNLRAAFEFCLDQPAQLGKGVVLATRLWLYWHARGRIGEGRRWLSVLLAAGRLRDLARSRALSVAAYLALVQGDAAAAFPWLEESLELARRAESSPAIGVTVGLQGWAHMLEGDLARAAELLDQAVALHHSEAVEPMSEGLGVYLRGLVALFQEDDELAAGLFQRGLAFCRARGERWLQASALLGLGILALRGGRQAEAVRWTRESVRLAQGLDDRWGLALAVEVLAWAAAAQGQAERAARLLGAAGALWSAVPASLPGIWSPAHDRYADELRRRLGEARFQAAVGAGARLPRREVVELALEERAAPAPAPEPPGEAVQLTPREREIANLVAAGLSNREIAARLVISVRTAETHVENILGKLGFDSRAQIAAWAASRRA
jgi:non-specific serine/threonine protein kinase